MTHDDRQISLSVVVPCFNEEGNIPSLFLEAKEVAERHPEIEFIMVDNGSTDNTLNVMMANANGFEGIRIVQILQNKGYGYGIKEGLKEARGQLIGWTHADRQTKLKDVIWALKLLGGSQQNSFVKGLRKNRPVSDRIFTSGMSAFESLLFRTSLRDINAQPTIFSRDLHKVVAFGPDDFSLDLFAYVAAKKRKYKVLRFKVDFGARFSGESKWNTSRRARIKFISRTIAFSLRLARHEAHP